MLNWGGFYDFPPLAKNHPLSDDEFFGGSNIEHFRMRYCLRRSSRQSGIPNPFEYSTEDSPKPVWEPLSEPTPAVAEFNPLASFREETQKVEEQVPSDPTISSASSAEATTSPIPTPFVSTTSTSQIDEEELAAQLRIARSFAKQVTQELANKHTKQQRPPKLEAAPSEPKEDSLFETSAHPAEEYSTIDAKENLDAAESTKAPESKPTESRLEQTDESQNGSVLDKLKGAWGRLF